MITGVRQGVIAAMMFIVDLASLIQDTGQQIDWTLSGVARFHRGAFGVRNTTAVVASDTTIAVAALQYALPAGSVIDFGAGDKIVLTADAAEGATSITVNPAHSAIADETTGYAIQPGYVDGGFRIPAGTIMARNATNFKLFPRALVTGAETAECVLLTDAKSDSKTDSLTGYGVTYGGIFYENMMPDAVVATGLVTSGWKTELGARFVWRKYRDSRGE